MQRCFAFVSTGIFFLLAAPGWSQEFRGSLSGRVVDQQQAVIPNVTIVATQTDTGAKFETISGNDGSYTLPFLPPGLYRVTAQAPGFKRYINDNVRVTTN